MPYTPTTWNPGAAPGISAANLNKIEDGLVDAHDFVDSPFVGAPGAARQTQQIFTTTTYVTFDDQTISIPASWPSYGLLVLAKFRTFSLGRVRITATPGGIGTNFTCGLFSNTEYGSHNFFTPGLTSTGTITVALQFALDSGTDPDLTVHFSHLHVMAFRESQA